MTAPLVCAADASVAAQFFIPEPLTARAVALFDHLTDPATVLRVPI